jgi:hypothetical protein
MDLEHARHHHFNLGFPPPANSSQATPRRFAGIHLGVRKDHILLPSRSP